TPCLQYIHGVTDPQRRTRLYSLNTASDRTLFFDLMSLDLGRIRGFRLALQLYTVPGQVQYNATRRAVLSGADGVVFVADSQENQREANRESLANLWENLAANGLDREKTPLVLQYNKRDLSPLLSIEQLQTDLNERGVPYFPSIATEGKGVMEAFHAITEATLIAVADKLGLGGNPQAIERIRQRVRAVMLPFEKRSGAAESATEERTKVTSRADSSVSHLGKDALVQEAVRANVAMTDLNVRLDELSRQLERKATILTSIATFGQEVASERDPDGVLHRLIRNVGQLLDVAGASVLVVPGSGSLRPAVSRGLKADPLLVTADEVGEPLALTILEARKPRLYGLEDEETDNPLVAEALRSAGFNSMMAVPLIAGDRVAGLLTAYAASTRIPFDDNDLQLATVLAATAGVAHSNALAWRRLEELNRGLESQVTARTQELQKALKDVQNMAADLERKNALLDRAYRELAKFDRVKNELVTRLAGELKDPVSTVLTAARVLRDSNDQDPKSRERLVGVVFSEAEKLGQILENLLQTSMLVNSQKPPKVQTVPVQSFIRETIAPLRELAEERNVSLHIKLASGLEVFRGDPETLAAALRAVVRNAIELSPAGSSVELELRQFRSENGPWIAVRVRDEGPGIPEDELPHVTEALWRGSAAVAGKEGGLGLGLTIADRVMTAHGGRLAIESPPGKGTTVTLTWPT
ncbi:MAG TPA: GAF domain-containing protein, partial [Acidobacteria bacterium]|nr:GAF domain-containing protein [Acidobacteriota bacterium]